MGTVPPVAEDASMINGTRSDTGRTPLDTAAVTREARRLVGFERSYRCGGCGHEDRSWSRLSTCPDCGTAYVAAIIHRAALA
jgi:hypothetical protein